MIYLYNQTNTQYWEIVEKNEKFFRVNIKADTKYHFGIDIVKKDYTLDDFFMDALDDAAYYARKQIWGLADMSFSLCYNIKNGIPFLKPVNTPSPYSYDLVLLTYQKTPGMTLISEKPSRFTVLDVNETDDVVHIIAISKPANRPHYFLTYMADSVEPGKHIYYTKHLVTEKSGDLSIYTHTYQEDELNGSKYKANILGDNTPTSIKVAKSMKPYSLIIYPFSKENFKADVCEKRYGCNDKYNRYIDANGKNLPSVLYNLRKNEFYSAATFYMDHPFSELTEEHVAKECWWSTKFKRVNYLCSDGKMKSFS